MKNLFYILGAGILVMFPCQSRAEGFLQALAKASLIEPAEPGTPNEPGEPACTKEKLEQACLILQGCYAVYFDTTDLNGQEIVDKCLDSVACQMVQKYKPCTEDIFVYSDKTTDRPPKFLGLNCGNETHRFPGRRPYTAKVSLPSVKQCEDKGLL